MSLTLAFSHILTHTLSFLLACSPCLPHTHAHTLSSALALTHSLDGETNFITSLHINKKNVSGLGGLVKNISHLVFLTSLANNNNNARDKSMITYLLPKVQLQHCSSPMKLFYLETIFRYAGPVLFQAAQLGIFRIPSPLVHIEGSL